MLCENLMAKKNDLITTYVDFDFESSKRRLIDNINTYFSGVIGDTDDSTAVSMLLNIVATSHDSLSYLINRNFNETFLQSAVELKNVYKRAKFLGYKPKGKKASIVDLSVFVQVPAKTLSSGEVVPDSQYMPVLKKNSQAIGPNNIFFETLDDVDFSNEKSVMPYIGPLEFTASIIDDTTKLPTSFILKKQVEAVSLKTKSETFSIGSFESFKKITINDDDVLEVISIVDSSDNEWTEVEYLAQDFVFESKKNFDDDSLYVPYILKIQNVPRRYITDYNPITKKTSIIFGSGDGQSLDSDLIPNVGDLAIPLYGKSSFSSISIDPQNFLKTKSMGIGPSNTILNVTYRVGGGISSNVPERSIDSFSNANIEFKFDGLDSSKTTSVRQSIDCINYLPSSRGDDEESIDDIKQNSAAFFASQSRCVTPEDFVVRALSIPEKFGSVFRAYVDKSVLNSIGVNLYVLSKNENNNLITASRTLKNNLKRYLSKFKLPGVGIDILDVDIINIGCRFNILTTDEFNRSEVKIRCINKLINFFNIKNWQIKQPIIISELKASIQEIKGVISIFDLEFFNAVGLKNGLSYSNVQFDIISNIKNGILYCPRNSIFEVKYPKTDIQIAGG